MLKWIMTTMRKRYSAAFKAQIVQELLKENKSLTQLASEYGVHPNQLRDWKKVALQGLPSLFEANKNTNAAALDQVQKIDELYAQIGRLTTQVAWLKKKSGLDPHSS
jgi:transposase